MQRNPIPTTPARNTVNRRAFLSASTAASAAAVAGSAGLSLLTNRIAAAQTPAVSEVVQGKDSRLIVHTADIAVLETPPELLTSQITPLDLLFVRNNGQPKGTASVNPVALDDWNVEFVGAINGKKSIAAKDLLDMPMKSHEMVLQCCGNGRALFANSVKAKGTQWLRGGMGNISIKGIPLSDVLEKLGVQISSDAVYLTAEGNEPAAPGKEEFEHSLPLAEALSRSVLAVEMNGRPIPQCHGGPLRLVTPGYFGTMHIKWLRRLRFEANESRNYNHTSRYRAPHQVIEPGAAFKYNVENSRPCWSLKLKSVVLSPLPGAMLKSNQAVTVSGVAFNDGLASIETVLISKDRGNTWMRVAKLKKPASKFAWYRWEHPLRLSAGEHEIWTRAVDRLGRSQPIDGSIHWNPSGYEWNGVEKLNVRVV